MAPRDVLTGLTCFVSDANGRVATDSIEVEVGFVAGSIGGE